MYATLLSPALGTFAAACNANATFLGIFKPWYAYLQVGKDSVGNCSIMNFTALGSHSGFLLIALAILEDLVRLAALVAVGYVIYGGIQYVTSQGSPDSTKKAQQTIINALVGVVIAVLAASLVAYIGGQLA